jgi:class 3 adenylate cyclase
MLAWLVPFSILLVGLGYRLGVNSQARESIRLQAERGALDLERQLFYRIRAVYTSTSEAIQHEARDPSTPMDESPMTYPRLRTTQFPPDLVDGAVGDPLFVAPGNPNADVSLWPPMTGTLLPQPGAQAMPVPSSASLPPGQQVGAVSAAELLRRCHDRRAQRGCPGQRRRGLVTDCAFVGDVGQASAQAIRGMPDATRG